ncbi:MAG: DUF5711 family protein [Oscillospiraceae bacterium]|nr:DUF5711 family protein [Oscillospiraceae bacterium]
MRKIITYLIIVGVVLSAVVAFVVLRDDFDDDTLGFFRGCFSRSGEPAKAGQIPLDERRGAILALCDGKLVSLSGDRFVLYDKAGREKVSRAVSFKEPALAVAGKKVIAYDRVQNTAIVADTGKVLAEIPGVELAAAGNARGQIVLVTNEKGYRGKAEVYDHKNRLTYKWLSAEDYILAVSLSPSGKRMAVAAVGQRGETVSARITFLEPGRAEPLGFAEFEDQIPLAAYSPDNNHVCIITESGVYFYTDDGRQLGYYPYGTGQKLLSMHPTDEALILNLGRNEGGQHSRLICLSYTGAEMDAVQFAEGPDGIAAAGRYIAVLEAGILTRYTIGGTSLRAEDLGSCGARDLLISPGGDILLLFSDYGEWYND